MNVLQPSTAPPAPTAGALPERQLRVLMVTAAYPTPGNPHSGTFIKSQIESLGHANVKTTVLHLQGRSPWKYVAGLWQVFRLARPARFDLVHGHYGYCGIVARAQWRLPVVVSFCGDDLLGTPDRRGRRTLRSRLTVMSSVVLAQTVDGVIVKSREMGRVLRPRPRAPVAVIPNGVDLDLFQPCPRNVARERLGLDPGKRYVVFPADPAIPRKAFSVAQDAVAQLRAEGLAIEIIPVFNRPQTELVDFFNAADVVALPSLWEGSPNVVKEAMACSAPLVVADVGDTRELLGSVPGCALVPRTPEAFARAIRAALDIPGGRTRGREAVRHLSVASVAQRVRRVYEVLVGNSGRKSAAGERPPLTHSAAGPVIVTAHPNNATTTPSAGTTIGSMRPACMLVYNDYSVDARVQRYVDTLLDAGCQVDVFAIGGPKNPRPGLRIFSLSSSKVRGHSVSSYLAAQLQFLLIAVFHIARASIRRPYGVIHVHNMPDFLVFAALVPKLLGAKVILDIHDTSPEHFATKFGFTLSHPLIRLIRMQERLSARLADRLITANDLQKEALAGHGIPKEKILVVMNLAREDVFQPLPCQQPHTSLNLVYHGTVAERLGIDLILRAIQKVRRDCQQVRFLLIGGGESMPMIKELRSELCLENMVTIVEGNIPVEDLPNYLSHADAGVIGNRLQTELRHNWMLPAKMLEYAAMEIPTIAPALRVIRRYFGDGDAIFYQPDSVDALADRIRDVYHHRERLTNVKRGLQAFNARYKWSDMRVRYLDLIQGLVKV